ncbi:MAG: phosphoheptose isomerase [Zetaproteobacteria bacterium CG_4_9_14_3_um_filter_49_83]|nr:MAG: phosphoheptose isomerase [Zetaproteobacteria bacterium CG1_02_49_23]PIQ34582.1 MAG: phosphoheptose isomerase [Zetaproteobacteria bacterium CG17_big_fil_post_rev_8_21_14_2_50_50_13]PIV31571.1 MAG: phosphoheptose isomerase [Zetaproteobacteria bacterium CG02_land_8_20_14_3_00_50_9]PIY54833.1 MAG: phosphoheptose isomerase [Zetaproteobacteria bacterium CG_4_10_14_0_8_um_filter_49_80]PJA35800.1 MAG: phosphoheptose isomerase [Zetaproteobacteria bacterium CG_4_9_14_3_um_filter_49_83]
MQKLIEKALLDGIELRQQSLETLTEPLLEATKILTASLRKGGKILLCGNGGSAADAQHFAGELVNRFEVDRPGLAAFALTNDASVITSIANDIEFDAVYSRQVEALGRNVDVLIAISTSGHSTNIIRAVKAAHLIGMPVIVLTGKDGGELKDCAGVMVNIQISHPSTPRIQEMHITCLHILCTLIDEEMFGKN